MKRNIVLKVVLISLLSGVISHLSHSQTYVRYVKAEDLQSKVVYADSVLTSIVLPRGISELSNYPKFNAAAYELAEVLKDKDKQLLKVWVCGSASPDGIWGFNVKLSKARTDAAASYLKDVLNIPAELIHKESLNEDWDRLYELVEASDMICREEVLNIIKTKTWGARKTALQELEGGKVWDILVKDFFPQLRCVRFAIYCKWDQTKPYLTAPEPVYIRDTVIHQVRDTVIHQVRDTVYVKDTVVIVQAAPVKEAYEEYREENMKKSKRNIQWLNPNVMAVKTNLVSDAMAIPSLGLEFQLAKFLSLDVQGAYGFFNLLNPSNRNMTYYGVTPELRFWVGKHAVQKGSFFGLHGNVGWYSMTWKDGITYSNAAGTPAWSAGLTYGYTACLDRKAHWGLEFLIGAGYGRYLQDVGNGKLESKEHFGLTRLGINLVYRFSLAGKKQQ